MFGQLLLQLVSGLFTSTLRLLMAKFKELNGDEKAKQLNDSIKNSFLLLKSVTDKTPSKADDVPVNAVLAACD